MEREITLKQLVAWIKKHENHTWSDNKTCDFREGSMRIKYLSFNLDTRDMKIFSITTSGLGREAHVDFRDEAKGNILDQLEAVLEINSFRKEGESIT